MTIYVWCCHCYLDDRGEYSTDAEHCVDMTNGCHSVRLEDWH